MFGMYDLKTKTSRWSSVAVQKDRKAPTTLGGINVKG